MCYQENSVGHDTQQVALQTDMTFQSRDTEHHHHTYIHTYIKALLKRWHNASISQWRKCNFGPVLPLCNLPQRGTARFTRSVIDDNMFLYLYNSFVLRNDIAKMWRVIVKRSQIHIVWQRVSRKSVQRRRRKLVEKKNIDVNYNAHFSVTQSGRP